MLMNRGLVTLMLAVVLAGCGGTGEESGSPEERKAAADAAVQKAEDEEMARYQAQKASSRKK